LLRLHLQQPGEVDKKGAGASGKEKIVSAEHAITDLIARERKSQANATRDGL